MNLWEEAGELGAMLRAKGATVKTLDLLIATYAITHAVPLLTNDADLRAIAQAGVGLILS